MSTIPVQPDARDAARDFIRHGCQPIPVLRRSKNPNRDGWQNERRTESNVESDFSSNSNVGLLLGEPSGGVVDVDLDCPEAVALSDTFLPPTPMVHGRTSSRRAHRYYRCQPPPKTIKFQDVTPDGPAKNGAKAQMLVELRSTGCQTIVPPSLHPCGERLEWEGGLLPGEPAVVDAAELVTAVQRLAAAVLMVRHYPAKGAREDFAMALAGTLLCAGWQP